MDAHTGVRILMRGALENVSGATKLFMMNQTHRIGACALLLLIGKTEHKVLTYLVANKCMGIVLSWCSACEPEEEVNSLPFSHFPFPHMVVSVPGSLPHHTPGLPGVVTLPREKLMNCFFGFFLGKDAFLLFIFWEIFIEHFSSARHPATY